MSSNTKVFEDKMKSSVEPVSYTHLDVYKRQMVGCSAVRADHDVVLKGQRLAAALTGTAIIFRHDILL